MKLGWLDGNGSIFGFCVLGLGGAGIFGYFVITSGSLTVALVALVLGAINIVFQYANFGGRFDTHHKMPVKWIEEHETKVFGEEPK